MDRNKLVIIIMVVSIFLVIHGISQTGSKDKKAAQAAQGEVMVGTIGFGATTLFKKQILPAIAFIPTFMWVIGGVIAAGLFIPGAIGNIVDIFRPQPTIPGWVWIVGFFILALMVIGNKNK